MTMIDIAYPQRSRTITALGRITQGLTTKVGGNDTAGIALGADLSVAFPNSSYDMTRLTSSLL